MASLLGVRDRWVVRVAVLVTVLALALPAGASATSRVRPAPRPWCRRWKALRRAVGGLVAVRPRAAGRDEPAAGSDRRGLRTGKAGPMFFLAGDCGSGTFTRDRCTVPLGRLLFFPLLNAFDVHTPGDGLDTPELVYEDFLKLGFRADKLMPASTASPSPTSTPRGRPTGRAPRPWGGFPRTFSLVFPDPNLFGFPAGTYAPAVDDGYYLLLLPLRPGVHTVEVRRDRQFRRTDGPGHHLPPPRRALRSLHRASSPPSTVSASPVTNDAASELSHAIAPATSAGRPCGPSARSR